MSFGDLTCEWCGVEFERPNHRGPTPKYCTDAHRQAAHRARHSTPKFDTSLFEAAFPKIDTSLFEAIMPKFDTSLFEAAFANIDASLFEAAFANIDASLFEAALPKFATSLFEAAFPKIDTSLFEAIIPKIDLALLDRIRARLDPSLLEPDWLESLPTSEVGEPTDYVAGAVLLLAIALYLALREEIVAMARGVAQSLWYAWVLHWQVANSSPQGGLAVLLADYAALRAIRATSGTSEDADEGS
jgi:hypothetical protein